MRIILAVMLAMFMLDAAWAAEIAKPSPAFGGYGDREQLIDQLLAVSGMKKSLQILPAQIAGDFMQAALRSGASKDEERELETTLGDAFPKDGFLNPVRDALRKNYDDQRFAHLLQLLSAPLATRMLKLEEQEPRAADMQNFLAQVSKSPLPPERIKLIQRMDGATQSSALLTAVTIASLEAMAHAAGDDCSNAAARVKGMIAQNRSQIEKSNRSTAQIMLAFTYRDVSDADLVGYVKVYEDKDARWVQDIAQAAIAGQLKRSMTQGAQGIKPIIQAHKRKKTMFAPKCGESESPNGDEPANEEPVKEEPVKEVRDSKKHISRVPDRKSISDRKVIIAAGKPGGKVRRNPSPGRDLRDCLLLATDAEVIACAEK